MELASIYLNETKLDQNNKFTINFLTTESDFNVFFNRNTVCYITNLDLNLILDDETITQTHHEKVIELSKLSNELITKSFINRKFNNVRLVNYRFSYVNLNHKLYLNKEIVDIFSYKYEFLDTTDNKIKKCKIYDQYQHLKAGMQFEYNDVSTYKVNITDNKLIKKLEHNSEKFKIDWLKYINCIVTTNGTNVTMKTPLYNELYNLFKDHNIPISKKELFYQYYFKIDLLNHRVICNEDIYNSLSYANKQDVVFVALKNKKIRVIKNKTFWITSENIRGHHRFSFVNDLVFRKSLILNKTFQNDIKKIDPIFPLTRLDEFITLTRNIDLDILDNDVQFFSSINYNPYYFIASNDIDERNFFGSRIGITDKNQIDILSKVEKKNLKNFMSKEVDEIKQLLEEEEVI